MGDAARKLFAVVNEVPPIRERDIEFDDGDGGGGEFDTESIKITVVANGWLVEVYDNDGDVETSVFEEGNSPTMLAYLAEAAGANIDFE